LKNFKREIEYENSPKNGYGAKSSRSVICKSKRIMKKAKRSLKNQRTLRVGHNAPKQTESTQAIKSNNE
jgi:hypothetical protein